MDASGLTSGDILLFSGHSYFSKIIQLFTKSKWSHVGIVLVKDGITYCLESDESPLANGYIETGVRLTEINKRIDLYDGCVSFRKLLMKEDHRFSPNALNEPLDDYVLNIISSRLSLFGDEVKGRPYEKNLIELIDSAYDGPFGKNIEDLSSLFCSELVAAAYQSLKILDKPPMGEPSNEYTPADFAKESMKLLYVYHPYKTRPYRYVLGDITNCKF